MGFGGTSVGIEQFLSLMMAKVDGVGQELGNMHSQFTIMFRILYEKNMITDEDVFNSVKKEHQILKEAGVIEEIPDDEKLQSLTDDILVWIRGDMDVIKQHVEKQKQQIEEIRQKQQSKIEVAPSDVLTQLDRAKQQSKKLII